MFVKKIILIFLFFVSVVVNAQTPRRIVSLVPSITKQLYDLGLENKIVGCTTYCKSKNKKGVEVVASAVQVNVEKTLLLQPDLILASSLTNPKTIETFKKMGVRVLYFKAPESFDDLCNQFVLLADICGVKNKAEQIVDAQKLRLKQIVSDIRPEPKPCIFIQIGTNPLWTVIDDSFMGDYIRLLGGVNIAAGLKSGSISRETVLVKNPDVIFITMPPATAEIEKKTWMNYKFLKAVKNNRIFILNADKTNAPSVIEFVDVLFEMKNNMYSETKKL